MSLVSEAVVSFEPWLQCEPFHYRFRLGRIDQMIKKTLYITAGVTLMTALCFGRNALSYIKTTADRVATSVKSNVPIEFEIDHARQMIKDLTPEIRRNMHLIAKEEIQVEHLEKRVAQSNQQLATDRDEIFQLKNAIDDGGDHCFLAGKRYSIQQIKSDLANRFQHYKTADETSFNLRKVLDARKRGLDAARQKLNGMLAAKRQLEVDVENLEARMKMVEVAQTTSEFNFDDSHLARTKELIHDIQTRLEVSERLLNAEADFHDRIPLETTESFDEKISDEVTAYFGGQEDKKEAAEVASEHEMDALMATFSLQ